MYLRQLTVTVVPAGLHGANIGFELRHHRCVSWTFSKSRPASGIRRTLKALAMIHVLQNSLHEKSPVMLDAQIHLVMRELDLVDPVSPLLHGVHEARAPHDTTPRPASSSGKSRRSVVSTRAG